MNKRIIKGWIKLFIVILCIYTVITITIMRFYQPQLSETQLFLNIPQAWIWKFN
jgi:hypothetical protein